MDDPGADLLVEYTPDPGLPVSTAVVEAVSSVSDTPPERLPVLAESVDPEALDALFSRSVDSLTVEFSFAGYLVVVHADRTIEIRELEGEPDHSGRPV